jgi:hypothetical protein
MHVSENQNFHLLLLLTKHTSGIKQAAMECRQLSKDDRKLNQNRKMAK